jgi:hypothetical protein
MNDKSLGITTIPMMAEPEDARLTGHAQSGTFPPVAEYNATWQSDSDSH